MSSVTPPDLFTGIIPVTDANLSDIHGSDPSEYTITKIHDYEDGGPQGPLGADPPYRYFGTGDIAKMQSAVLLSDVEGSWHNPDMTEGGIVSNAEFTDQVSAMGGCICANGGLFMGFIPAHFIFDPSFMGGVGPAGPCFSDINELQNYVETPRADGGIGIPRTLTLPSTTLITKSKNTIQAINEMVGTPEIADNDQASFGYTSLKIDQLISDIQKHFGPVYTSTDYARIKAKIGMVSDITDGLFEGNVYSGLELNYDSHTGFVNGFHNISGNIVFTTGDQYITGHKIFDDSTTTISGTGYINTVIGGIGCEMNPQDRFSSILGGWRNSSRGLYSAVLGGSNQSISSSYSDGTGPQRSSNLLGVGNLNFIEDDGVLSPNSTFNSILNGEGNEIINSNYTFIDGGQDAYVSGGFSNAVIGACRGARLDGAKNSQISSSRFVNINNSGVEALAKLDGSALPPWRDANQYLNNFAIAIGCQNSEMNNEGQSEANVLLGTSLATVSGWNYNSAILGGFENKLLTWGGTDNLILNGLENLISGDTRKGARLNPSNCLTAGGYSQVLAHKGAFVLSDSLDIPDKYSVGDDTLSLYFSQGVYASGDLYQYQDGSYSKVLTQKSLETGFGDFNISGDLRVTGNSYLSGELWILGPDGEPCKVACSGDSSTFNQHTTFNSGVSISGDTIISGGLTVNNHATFNSGVSISGDLNVTGNSYLSGELWILGPNGPCQVACSGAGGITVEGDTTNFNSTNVNISGDTLISGGLTVNKHATFNSGVTVNSGDLTINSGNLNMSGDLNVTGNAYISGQLWILGPDGQPCRVACSGEGGTASPLTTKGDLWGYDSDNARLPVGSDGQVLAVNPNTSLGVNWKSPCDAFSGCHAFGNGDFFVGYPQAKIAQYDHLGSLTDSLGASMGSYSFGAMVATISGANFAYQINEVIVGGQEPSITGFIGQSNIIMGGLRNSIKNAEGDSIPGDDQGEAPWYSTIIGGAYNSITGHGLHAGLILGGRQNAILAKETAGNSNRAASQSDVDNDAGFNTILGGAENLITQTENSTDPAYTSLNIDTWGNTIIGGQLARIENQNQTVFIQAGSRGGYAYAHTGDGTISERGRTMTLSAANGIFASGNLYVTGAGNSWIRITGGAGGGGGGLTSPLTTKGDLWGYDTDNARLPVGSDGQVLIADAGAALGVRWGDTGAGSDFTGDLSVSGCIKSYQCVTDSSDASYTLSASDFGKIVHYNPASDAVFNLPTTASVPTIADGWQATVMNMSSNKITLTPLGGLVLKSDGTIIAGQYQAATVYYQGGDWYAVGALSS